MRKNLEAEALREFAEIAASRRLAVFQGQGAANRLVLSGNNYFQFGDLQVETDVLTVVVETESGGGVTNLTKYWYWLGRNASSKPLALIHLFQQASQNDYVAHLEIWDFLADRMMKDLGDKFWTRRFCFRQMSDLAPALEEFRRLLETGTVA